jgi:hypothetical protein
MPLLLVHARARISHSPGRRQTSPACARPRKRSICRFAGKPNLRLHELIDLQTLTGVSEPNASRRPGSRRCPRHSSGDVLVMGQSGCETLDTQIGTVTVDVPAGLCWAGAIGDSTKDGCGSQSFEITDQAIISANAQKLDEGHWPVTLTLTMDGNTLDTSRDSHESRFRRGRLVRWCIRASFVSLGRQPQARGRPGRITPVSQVCGQPT